MSDRLEGAPVGAAVDPVSATGELAATGPAVRRHVSPMLIPGWLMAGLRDFMGAPLPSLLVGGACVLLSWMLS
ncbi:MAG TPA: hypothetical protein VK458_11975, partial [Myxococcaceae bacterium]|nr:hypothetical protein [Myxococcaceae bacterium]